MFESKFEVQQAVACGVEYFLQILCIYVSLLLLLFKLELPEQLLFLIESQGLLALFSLNFFELVCHLQWQFAKLAFKVWLISIKEMSYFIANVTPFPKFDSEVKIIAKPAKVAYIFVIDFSKSSIILYLLAEFIVVIISILAKSKVLIFTNNFELKLGCSPYSNLPKLSLKVKTETC